MDVRGDQFAQGTSSTMLVFSTPLDLGAHPVDENGELSVRLNVPGDLESGSHLLVAEGEGSDGRPRMLLATFEVPPLATGAPLLGVLRPTEEPSSSAQPTVLAAEQTGAGTKNALVFVAGVVALGATLAAVGVVRIGRRRAE